MCVHSSRRPLAVGWALRLRLEYSSQGWHKEGSERAFSVGSARIGDTCADPRPRVDMGEEIFRVLGPGEAAILLGVVVTALDLARLREAEAEAEREAAQEKLVESVLLGGDGGPRMVLTQGLKRDLAARTKPRGFFY